MSSPIVPSFSLRLWLPPLAGVLSLAAVACTPPAIDVPEERASTSSAIDVPLPPDADQDGVPDALDCDPQSSTLGARIVDDDLSEAKGLIAAAPDFSESAWEHADGTFEEGSVRDHADAAFFTGATQGDVYARVTVSITDIDESADDPLRQAFLLVGATDEGGDFYAYGCGIELVGDVAKASIVKLGGSPDDVTTARLAHVVRDLVEEDEDVEIEMKTEGGVLTCTVTQAASVSSLTANDIGTISGSVGLFTRQLAAAFKDAKVCQVGGGAVPTPATPATSVTSADGDN